MTLSIPGYTEVSELGSGATGTVMLARHEQTDEMAAIKHLSAELCTTTFLDQFRNEARLLERIDHPNVTKLFDYREENGEAAYAMELVTGVSLRTLLDDAPLDEPCAALAVLKGSLLGLGAAHDVGVVHRDYKPENVMVEADGTSKLVDFGVAVPVGDVKWRGGTPKYMAPEAWETGEVSPSTDVYAATAVFLECLIGHAPFDGHNVSALMKQHKTGEIPLDGVPDALKPLALRGLAKSPELRYADAGEFVAELEAIAVATYGKDWEKRGKKKLAALVLLFLPFGAGGGAAGAGAAYLGLGSRAAATAAVVVAAVLLIGGGVTFVLSGHHSKDVATITSVPQPSPLVTPLPTATMTAAPTAAPTATATPTAAPTPSATPTAKPTAKPTPKPTAKPTPTATAAPTPPPLGITAVRLSYGSPCMNPNGSGWTCTWTMLVVTSSTQPGTFQYHVDGTAYQCPAAAPGQTQSNSTTGTYQANGGTTSYSITGTLFYTVNPNTVRATPRDISTATAIGSNTITSPAAIFESSIGC